MPAQPTAMECVAPPVPCASRPLPCVLPVCDDELSRRRRVVRTQPSTSAYSGWRCTNSAAYEQAGITFSPCACACCSAAAADRARHAGMGDDQAPILQQVVQLGLVAVQLQREALPLRIVFDREKGRCAHGPARAMECIVWSGARRGDVKPRAALRHFRPGHAGAEPAPALRRAREPCDRLRERRCRLKSRSTRPLPNVDKRTNPTWDLRSPSRCNRTGPSA